MTDIQIVVSLGIGAFVLLIAVVVLDFINAARGKGTPTQQAILAALEPFAHQAIFAGESIALDAMEGAKIAVAGADRAKIANAVYDALPAALWIGKTPIPVGAVKAVVSREQFAALIENVYQQTQVFISKNEAFLKGKVDALNAPTVNVKALETAGR